MRRFFAHIPYLAVCLSLVLMYQALAIARGHGSALQSVVLCTGHGLVMVSLGADGTPVIAPDLCPDAVMQAVALPEQHDAVARIITDWRVVVSPKIGYFLTNDPSVIAVARGPPLGSKMTST
jgi:hypothetical protein